MLKSFILIAVRSIKKNKIHSVINIAGLSVGIACCLLIMLWVRDELSYDRFHSEAGLLYRVNWDVKTADNEGIGPGTPPPLAAKLVQEVPGVTAATRLRNMPSTVVRSQDQFFSERGIVAADSNLFDVLGFALIQGNSATALRSPNSVILTEETARKYFGEESAIGKTLRIGEKEPFRGAMYHDNFTVTGVVQNPPHNSHIQFTMLTSMSSYPEVAWRTWSWVWMQMATYARLEPSIDVSVVEERVQGVVKKYLPAAFTRVGFSYDELIKNGGRWNFVFQPMTDVYLGSTDIGNRLGPTGNRTNVYLFATIACFILLIACMNFMNLATARSLTRAREVGMRKILGSGKKTLVVQFLLESLLFSALAMVFAFFLVEALMEPFNMLSGKNLHFNFLDPTWLPAVLILLTLLVALIAGSYPSFRLSSFRPLHAFQGPTSFTSRRWSLRNMLVLFQFTVTIGLIACTILVERQMQYVGTADVGFRKEGVVIISNANNRLGNHVDVYKESILRHAQVLNASVSTGVPPYWGFEDGYKTEGGGDQPFALISYMADEHFVNTLGIEIVQGRGFSKDFSTNASGIILNEAAVKYLGWEDAIGKTITYPGGNSTFQVIGVMKDFHFSSMRSPITPFALFHTASGTYRIASSFIVVRVALADINNAMKILESEWKAVSPNTPFEYDFLENNLRMQYEAEQRFGGVFLAFSLLTIFIACLGLLGLVSFSTEQRTKEIGVRKVLGASVVDVVALLSKEFVRLILIANIIAWPVAYIAMSRWLEDFAYRAEIGWWVFVFAGGLTLLIALGTVSVQAVKAALANPVEALRYE